jgi:hypothetical protein
VDKTRTGTALDITLQSIAKVTVRAEDELFYDYQARRLLADTLRKEYLKGAPIWLARFGPYNKAKHGPIGQIPMNKRV